MIFTTDRSSLGHFIGVRLGVSTSHLAIAADLALTDVLMVRT